MDSDNQNHTPLGVNKDKKEDKVSSFIGTSGFTSTTTSSNRPLVLVDTNSRILKGALEKGMNNSKKKFNNMGSNNNNYSPIPNIPTATNSTQNSTTPPSPNIPYGTDELRRKVLGKFFTRSPDPKYISVRDEVTVREAFLDFVLNVPILVDGHHVGRKAWAKAFYESDIINSAKCLFEALFSEEEMRKCTLNGKNQTQELSAVKMLAILRASCWMKLKEQDPYIFNPEIDSHNIHPSREEQDKIEKKVFTERRSQANRKNRKRQHPLGGRGNNDISASTSATTTSKIEGDSDSQNMDLNSNSNASDEFTNMSIASPGGESFSSLASSSLSPHQNMQNPPPQTLIVAPVPRDIPTYEFGELEALFYRFPEEFLDTLLPSWRESYIFIDGLLVETSKWRKAWEEVSSDPVKAAWTLFLALFTDSEIRKCTLNGKNGTTELCPVKKLAIIRAVEWMRINQGAELEDPGIVTYFDNDDEDCNVFPSKEDKEKIETKVFTEKRYQQSRHLNLSKGGQMSMSMESSSPPSSLASLSPNPYQQTILMHQAMQR